MAAANVKSEHQVPAPQASKVKGANRGDRDNQPKQAALKLNPQHFDWFLNGIDLERLKLLSPMKNEAPGLLRGD